jgi:hypothetical protein
MAEVRFLLCRIYSFARMAAPGCFGVVARGTKIVPALHDLWGLYPACGGVAGGFL